MSKQVTEFICKVNGHPVYSGSKIGAQTAAQNALTQAAKEGRAEPEITFVKRDVIYGSSETNPETGEITSTTDSVKEYAVQF